MAGPEQALSKRVIAHLPGCRITRVENKVSLGFPDMLIGFKAPTKFVLLENKVVRTGNKVRLSAHQVAFHLGYAELGCPTWVLVEWQNKGELRLYPGRDVLALLDQGWPLKPAWCGPLRAIEWNLLRLVIVSG